MPLYLTKFSYTPATWARLIGNPEDRRKAAQSYIEAVGGKLHGFWYAFGTHDGYNLWEAPDNVSMAAVAVAISGGGALSSFETTVLLTVDETIEALRKAAAHLNAGGHIVVSHAAGVRPSRSLLVRAARIAAALTRSDWRVETGDLLAADRRERPSALSLTHVFEHGELEREAAAANLRIASSDVADDNTVVAVLAPR